MNHQQAHEKIQSLYLRGKGCTVERARKLERLHGINLNIQEDFDNGGFTYDGFDDIGNYKRIYVPYN
jgi:hypothetical protein